MKELNGNKDKVLKEIETFRKKINQLLDQFEKNVVQQLERKFKIFTKQIDFSLRELQATNTEIKASQDRLKFAAGNMPQKFVSIMQASQVVSNAEEKVMTSEREFSSTEMYFLANKKFQTLFTEIKDLGAIAIKVREKLRITGRQKYSVKMRSDESMSRSCYIVSACALNDDTIILADCFNRVLKRLDSSSWTVTGCCGVYYQPYTVCAITDTEVAVCGFASTLIQFVNVGRTMKKTRQIEVVVLCTGLAYVDERLLVTDKTSVYMFSLSGEQLKQLSHDQSEQRLFNSITALAVNSDKSKIYVADTKNGLIILDMNGKLVGKYSGDNLTSACGICLDHHDNLLVCRFNTMNVLQFSPDGKLIGEVLKTEG